MNINILTIFAEIFDALNFGVVSKSLDKELLKVKTFDIRKNSINKHNQVDSKPYGGGEGMVMMAEPIINTLKEINNKNTGKIIYLSPQGKKLNQENLLKLIIPLLKDRSYLMDKKKNLQKLDYENSWKYINQKLKKVINEN